MKLRTLLLAPIALALFPGATAAKTAPAVERYALRGYREFTHRCEPAATTGTEPVTVHTFEFADSARAGLFLSKLLSDFELTPGNTLERVPMARGPADAVNLNGTGWILPLLPRDSRRVDVLIATNREALLGEAARRLKAPPLRRTEVSHPVFMDKWDRYCFGTWGRVADIAADPENQTPESYFGWMGKVGLNAQVVDATGSWDLATSDNLMTWLRHYYAANNVKFQVVEWLQNTTDLYNRNPYLATFPGSGVMANWNYYGESPHAPGLLRDVQNAAFLRNFRRFDRDPNHLAVLDPDGEIGPFPIYFWGDYGPLQQRNFVRYLRDVRSFSLKEVSQRYFGKPGALAKWEDVALADWRTFYGWTDGALDLAGEWRIMRDDREVGMHEGWFHPAYSDADWIRLHYPGDMTLYSLTSRKEPKPLWLRRRIRIDPAPFKEGPVFLSVVPLTEQPLQVYVNGTRLGSVDPRFHTGWVFGQFDVTAQVRQNPELLVALRTSGRDLPSGPVFLTPKKLADFPTPDPLLNARRYDHFDFVDWAVADSAANTLRGIRASEPDRPIKVHAYADSSRGWKMIHDLGGFSHHTGSGAGWAYTVPKQYGLTWNVQDSSETGGSMGTVRDIKGLIGNLVFMGKNAHDYFHDLQSITTQPGMRQWLEQRLPAIRVMGRANAHASPIAGIRGWVNSSYLGEFARNENWRFGYDFGRGGDLTPLLDELRIRQGHLPYRAIVDEGNLCWDEAMTRELRTYVESGGVLLLQAGSGRHTFEVRDARPGPTLAGVRLTGEQPVRSELLMTVADPTFGGLTGKVGPAYAHGMAEPVKLSPEAGTDVIGTYADGTPAITRRTLGKGTVFFCAAGLWPGALREGLVKTLGSAIYAKVDGGGVDEVRTLRSNNGCEELLMLRGLGKESTVAWTLDFVPAAVYDPVTGQPVAATIAGTTASFRVNIPDWDFAWFAARRPNAADNFSHWLQRQTEIWGGLVKTRPAPEPPLFRDLDMNHDWKLVQTDSAAKARDLMKLDDNAAGLLPTELILWSAPGTGLQSGKGVVGLYRRDVDLPRGWEKDTFLHLSIAGNICWRDPWHGFRSPSEIFLNGTSVWRGERIDTARIDVTAAARPGRNRFEIIHEGEGLMPSMVLVRTLKPDRVIDLAGTWQAVDDLQAVREVALPGEVETAFVYRDIALPAEVANLECWLRVESDAVSSATFALVNGRRRYADTGARRDGHPLEVNITPDVRVGALNRVLLGNPGMQNGWQRAPHKYRTLELCFYTPGRWSGDGKGIRAALTTQELSAVEAAGRQVQLLPLATRSVAKTPLDLATCTAAEAAAYTPPPAILDLALAAGDGTVTDRSPNHLAVTVHGRCTPFRERDGTIAGIFLQGESAEPGYLEVRNGGMLEKQLSGRNYTICAWIKPLQGERSDAMLVRWHHVLAFGLGDKGVNYAINEQWPKTIRAETVLTQRAWNFLAVSLDGSHARLYVDGVEVGDRTFDRPQWGNSMPLFIGSAFGTSNFLNAKLASFAIFAGALGGAEAEKLYVRERERFAAQPAALWPEDRWCDLRIAAAGITDGAEIPSKFVLGPGTTAETADGKPVLQFDGKLSRLVVEDRPPVHLLSDPFTMILDFKPAAGAGGCIFRRYHDLNLNLDKDGTLRFDANIGRRNVAQFPKVIRPDEWNRLMLMYDGQVVRVEVDGKLVSRRNYPGKLSGSRYLPLIIGADNTWGPNGFSNHLPMQLREFSIAPFVPEVAESK